MKQLPQMFSHRFSSISFWHWKRVKLSVNLYGFIYLQNPTHWRLPPWRMDKIIKKITSGEMQILIQNFSFGLMLHAIFEKSFLDTFCCYQLGIFTKIFHRSQLLLIQCKGKALIFELPFSLLETSKSWHFNDQHYGFATFFVLKKALSLMQAWN